MCCFNRIFASSLNHLKWLKTMTNHFLMTQTGRAWNVFMWLMLFFGTGMLMCLYRCV